MENKNKLSIAQVLDSLSREDVLHEIKGDTVYFGYDSYGSSFFSDRNLRERISNPDLNFLKVVRALFFSFDIKTSNPSSVYSKIKLNKNKKIVQIIEIDSYSSLLTRRFCLEFFENIEDFEYGQFLITKNPFAFSWDSKEQDFLFLEENLLSLDSFFSEMKKEKKKQFFEFLENCLTKNTVSRRDRICLDDCRSYVIQSEVKDLRIFRKA